MNRVILWVVPAVITALAAVGAEPQTPDRDPRDLTPVTRLEAADHPPVDIVRDGRAAAVVYVVDPKAREAFEWRRYLNPPHPPRTPPALLLMVHELRDAIREATGVTPELVTELPPPGRPAIVIGDCAESRAAGIDAAALPAEGFVVRSAADRIYLVGSTRRLSGGRPNDGTAWAVADFLERFVGVRWYWPVELGGRSVPKTRSLAVGPTHYRDQPVFRLRQQGNGGGLFLMPLHYEGHNAMDRMPLPLPPGVAPPDGRPVTDVYFNPLLRHGDSCDFQPGLVQGSWGGFAISRDETDPLRSDAVFLRKEDGTRDTRWNCLTAPETLEAYVATLERLWNSGRPVRFSHNIVAENSCTVYVPRPQCCCDRCRQTAAEGGPTAAASQFAQRLAAVVKDRWPGRIVVLQPRDGACPRGFTAPDNLVVANAYPEGFSLGWALHPSVGSRFDDRLRAWGKAALWTAADSPGDWTHAPVAYPHLVRDFCARNRDALIGMDLRIFGGKIYISDAPTLYVWMRALWNPDLDVDAVLDEMCRRQFGPAAGTCRELLRLQCDRWEKTRLSRPLTMTDRVGWPQPGRGTGSRMEEFRLPVDQFREFWPPDVVARMKSLRDQAGREIDAAGDAASRRAFLFWTWTFDAFLDEAGHAYREPRERDVREAPLAPTTGLPAALTLDLGGNAVPAAGSEEAGGEPGAVALDLVLIPPGELLMGSPGDAWRFHPDEGPQHKVRITKPFYMGIHEVTRAQYASLMAPGAAVPHGNRPVLNVSWNEAVEFCGKLGRLTRRTVRLPTEAEWEYACRAGTTTAWFFGGPDKVAELADYAWYEGRPAGRHLVDMTHDVGGKKPNPWGLHDMYGNVAEWCADRFAPDFYASSPVDDPVGPEAGLFRVIRGGSTFNLLFAANPELARSARRTHAHPDARGPEQHGSKSEVGFRVVVEAGGPGR